MRGHLTLLVAMAFAMASCGKRAKKSDLFLNIKIDPAFTKSQKDTIVSDFDWFESFEIPQYRSVLRQDSLNWYETTRSGQTSVYAQNIPQVSVWFGDVFGGEKVKDVFNFIDDRTAYYVAPKTLSTSRLYSKRYALQADGKSLTLAKNIGATLFLTSIFQDSELLVGLGNSYISVSDSRVGIIELENEFFKIGTLGRDGAKVARMGVLVHESRHSDCNAEIKRSDVLASVKFRGSSWTLPAACTHGHVACPVGHDYAGMQVCDDHPWGAYGVSAVFAARLAQCENCSETARQVALMFAIDQVSRVKDAKKAFSGEMGPPDMKHAPRVLRDVR